MVANATTISAVLISDLLDLVLYSCRRKDVILTDWSCSYMHLCVYIIELLQLLQRLDIFMAHLCYNFNVFQVAKGLRNIFFFPEKGK